MYPFIEYCSVEIGNRDTLRPVSIDSYQQGISYNCFNRTMISGGYKQYLKHKTFRTYDSLIACVMEYEKKHEEEQAIKFPMLNYRTFLDIPPINLYDYYKSIGWDRKIKKINGLTINQHVKNWME